MNWLLKIVEGPMKGAEIALVDGLRLKVGSGDACDIVIADGSLPDVAFELDVSADAVALVQGDRTQVLRPFEICTVGTTEIAVGPADETWQPLTRPAPEPPPAPEEPPPAAEEPAAPEVSAEVQPGEAEPAEEKAEGEKPAGEASGAAEEKPPEEKKSRRSGCAIGCLAALILFVAATFLLWWFWPRVVERCPWAERTRVFAVEKARQGYGWAKGLLGLGRKDADGTLRKGPTLQEIAANHGLALVDGAGHRVLKGNVSRRTERQAIRALALADDPAVKFDLTDDESLRKSADELLFVVTEGALKATTASNRVVTLAGYAPTPADLEKSIRALNADVPGIDRLETKDIQVGGVPPPKPGQPVFAAAAETAERRAPRARGVKTPAKEDYPIAGILARPYPCVVMRDGMRLAEGAQIGKATIVKIEADKLILKSGGTTFEWRP